MTAPLRKIVRLEERWQERNGFQWMRFVEHLECGHELVSPDNWKLGGQDVNEVGQSRRCKACGEDPS